MVFKNIKLDEFKIKNQSGKGVQVWLKYDLRESKEKPYVVPAFKIIKQLRAMGINVEALVSKLLQEFAKAKGIKY